MVEELDRLKVTLEPKQYDHQVTIAFWFAIHLEIEEIVSALIKREILLKKIVTTGIQIMEAVDSDDDKSSDEDEDRKEEWDVGSNEKMNNEDEK